MTNDKINPDSIKATSRGVDQRVTSYNQSGGITAHTVHVGPTPRRLNQPQCQTLKDEILRDIPRDKKVLVMSVAGDHEAYAFADEILTWMRQQGLNVINDRGVTTTMIFGGAPLVGLKLEENRDGSCFLIVGASS